jgi:hypothetical protein
MDGESNVKLKNILYKEEFYLITYKNIEVRDVCIFLA